ncbi:BglG family transcription antiterminator [Bacillus sp. FSL K6-3431]|uniref:BglG family transcription antiterminator n=1 Tax=Bacillus sp. FSL K6-3431 TaxID=2921500 RepID=UPI0030F6FD73
MYVTTREKDIIELIIKTSGKHTAYSIATYLRVSARTIQRDLKSIEKILQSFDLHLVRNMDKGLLIEGKNEHIFRLIQHLVGMETIDQTPQERKLLLLLALLQEEFYTIQVLAMDLGVSITTLTTYLDELTDWLMNFNVRITRKRGVGIELIGTEPNKRKALAQYFLFHFNEELIESLFILESGKNSQEVILHYFLPEYLLTIDKLLDAAINNLQPRLADSDYIGLIVHICITMQRTETGFLLEEEIEEETMDLTHEYSQIMKIGMELEKTNSISLSKGDMIYLAIILKGSKLQAVEGLPYDKIVLSQMIKNLIRNVSTQLHVDLTKDFSLYQGLLAHMEPSIFRVKQKIALFNPLKEEIIRKYPLLFLAVKNYVEKEFKEMADFPDDEIAFIVLHFGSALVMQEEQLSIQALVLCPTGIGTSKMLASRIKKEIIEIDTVEIKSIKEVRQNGNVKSYDVIISTVRLPFINMDYILVSPLLNEENILAIKSYLKNNIGNLTKNKQYIKPEQQGASTSNQEKGSLTKALKELGEIHNSIDAVMSNFHVYRLPHKGYEATMEEMVRLAEKDKLLTDVKGVIEALKERERKGGLGIPNTGLALFHCRHEKVTELIFQIGYLDKPCTVKGMDGNNMYMKSLLLMLAPEELSVREQEIVSLISTSLIESNEAMLIFSSADEEAIRTKLENTFLDYLHTNLIKD